MKTLYLQLGRAGDILNILPLLWRDYCASGEHSLVMVSEPYASIFDGISYADFITAPNKFEDIAGAWPLAEAAAKEHGARLVCTQIYGTGLACAESCSSFMRESWAQVPGAPAWGTLPLIFDRRDEAREDSVKSQLLRFGRGKPYIVVSLSGTSSPFPHATELMRYLRETLGADFDLVDVSAFVAPRIFDLLGLLEGAHCLVTVDSGLLHLAHAVPTLPVAAFITREPSTWHGSPWRRQHIARLYYDEAPECFPAISRQTAAISRQTAVWHTWSDFTPRDADTARRMAFARATWKAEYAASGWWRPLPFRPTDQIRDSGDIGDPRPMPYVADLIEHVIHHDPADNDIIALTNSDVSFTPGLTGWVLDVVPRCGAAFSHRWDFKRLDKPLVNEAQVKRGMWYAGSDAFFFTARWWKAHRHEFPDMILGREQCDEVLRQLIKRHGGREIGGAIYHEKHESFWEQSGNLGDNPGNAHNRRLARQWFLRSGLRAGDPEWWRI